MQVQLLSRPPYKVIPKTNVLTEQPVLLYIVTMYYTSTVTQKGQITLPKSLRNKFNIRVRQKVIIGVEKNHIKILPASDITTIAGFLKDKIKRADSVLVAREDFERNYTRV